MSKDGFEELIERLETWDIYREIAECDDDKRRQELKKKLPAIDYPACFPNGKRSNAEAVPTGLAILDIDHIEDPKGLFERLSRCIDLSDIPFVHKTPSCHGLRLVFKCQPGLWSIKANQKWMADKILTVCPDVAGHIDTCVSDLARLSYAVPKSYFYRYDPTIWDWKPDPSVAFLNAQDIDSPSAASGAAVPPVGESAAASLTPSTEQSDPKRGGLQTHFHGIPLAQIAERWLERNGGYPQEGERNTTLYGLAIRLRYIADFKPEAIAACLPHCGLSDSEVMGLCISACRSNRLGGMPNDLRKVLDELEHKDSAPAAEPKPEPRNNFAERLPKLPIGLRESLIGLPDKMKMPVLCGIMPLAGAYATEIKVCYADGKEQRLNLITVIVGPQASGKSSVKDVLNIWLQRMREMDRAGREAEERYRALQRSRKSENLPPAPKYVIREVPLTISNAQMLWRLMNAQGKHLFSFGEEIDTVTKTNNAGSWSQKTDLYRMSFDNGYWGQDYSSENSVSGNMPVCYNFTVMGTLRAMYKFFKDETVENGLAGRSIFAPMPASHFEHMPEYDKNVTLTEAEHRKSQIEHAVDILCESRGFVETPELCKAMREWCDNKADEARESNDYVLDTFRKRSAVIGFRCGVIYQLLENGEKGSTKHFESPESIQFAILMAEYALQNQIDLFGSQLMLLEAGVQSAKGVSSTYLPLLPDTFTFDDLHKLCPDKSHDAIKMMVQRWKQTGSVVSIGKSTLQKAGAGRPTPSAAPASQQPPAASSNESNGVTSNKTQYPDTSQP